MKFVGLLSGGKDSCFNIVKCQMYGHELLCLANLMPPERNIEEMNSFMYQSAAHNALPAQASCFEVPLLRRAISGSAKVQSMQYTPTDNDEVEDLYYLLCLVKERFPDVMGVSVGAIVSNYQRIRVEDVCARLGLTVLSYLWQRDRKVLLDEIIDSGVVAVLVKVAGAGLEPSKHLGKDLGSLRPTLQRLHERFGLDLCGEGGEYETLVLDCPGFKKKISIVEASILYDEEDESVGNLVVKSLVLEDKVTGECCPWTDDQDCTAELTALLPELVPTLPLPSCGLMRSTDQPCAGMRTSSCVHVGGSGGTGLIFATDISRAVEGYVCQEETCAQLSQVLSSVDNIMLELNLSAQDVSFVNLVVSDLKHFDAVNRVYCSWIGTKRPPSRCCVQLDLPRGVLVGVHLSFIEYAGDHPQHPSLWRRQVLHVRSMSEWAPLCIGPYAQANILDATLVQVAGQIALDPTTMSVWRHGELLSGVDGTTLMTIIKDQLLLCMRHVHNVLTVCESSIQQALHCVVYVNIGQLGSIAGEEFIQQSTFWSEIQQSACSFLSNSSHRWRELSADEVDKAARCVGTTPWHVRENLHAAMAISEEDIDETNDLQSESCDMETHSSERVIPVIVVGVPAIPRDSLVEVEVCGTSSQSLPHELFCSRSSSSSSRPSEEEQTTAGRNPQWDHWPIWGGANRFIEGKMSTPLSSTETLGDFELSHSSSSSGCSGGLLSGTIRVCLESCTAYDSFALTIAVSRFAKLLQEELHAGSMGWSTVQSIRMFVPSKFVSTMETWDDLRIRTVLALREAGADVAVPLVLLPADLPKFAEGECLLSVLYTCVDLLQVKSEVWIQRITR